MASNSRTNKSKKNVQTSTLGKKKVLAITANHPEFAAAALVEKNVCRDFSTQMRLQEAKCVVHSVREIAECFGIEPSDVKKVISEHAAAFEDCPNFQYMVYVDSMYAKEYFFTSKGKLVLAALIDTPKAYDHWLQTTQDLEFLEAHS